MTGGNPGEVRANRPTCAPSSSSENWGNDFWNSPVTRMFLPTKEVEKCAMTSAAVLEASRAVAGAEEACGTSAGGE